MSPSSSTARSAGSAPQPHPSGPGGPVVGPGRKLDWAELTDVIDLSLVVGEQLLEHGASAPRVEQTVTCVGMALGCDQLDVLVSPNVIMVTSTEGREFRTKMRRILGLQVDLARVVALVEASRDAATGRYDRTILRARLARIEASLPRYPRPIAALAVGLVCAAFCRLFGGDWASCALVLGASSLGALLRHWLAGRKLAVALNVLVTAFVVSTLAALGTRVVTTATPQHALAAAVLLLIPGVPLMHAFEELVKGHALMAQGRRIILQVVPCVSMAQAGPTRQRGCRGLAQRDSVGPPAVRGVMPG